MQGPPGYGAPPYGAPPYGSPPYGYAPPPGCFGSPPRTGSGDMSALIILCTVFGALGAVAAILFPMVGFIIGIVVLALGAAATAMHDPRGWEGIGAGVIVIVVAVIFGFAFI